MSIKNQVVPEKKAVRIIANGKRARTWAVKPQEEKEIEMPDWFKCIYVTESCFATAYVMYGTMLLKIVYDNGAVTYVNNFDFDLPDTGIFISDERRNMDWSSVWNEIFVEDLIETKRIHWRDTPIAQETRMQNYQDSMIASDKKELEYISWKLNFESLLESAKLTWVHNKSQLPKFKQFLNRYIKELKAKES